MHLFLIIALAIPAGLYLMAGINNTVIGLREWRSSRQYKRYLRAQKMAEQKALLARQSQHARIWFMMHDSMPAFPRYNSDDTVPWLYVFGMFALILLGLL